MLRARWAAAVIAILCACGSDAERSTSSSASGAGGAGASGPGAGASSSTGFGGGTPVEIWCNATSDALCEALFACCTDARVLGSVGGTLEACKMQLDEECVPNVQSEIGGLFDTGSSVLDEGKLATCVAELQDLAAGGAACTQPPLWVYHTDCISAFEGQIAPGDACVTTPDDISFVECSHGMCQNGTCNPFKKEGEPCVVGQGDDFCDFTEGLWCAFDGTTASCKPRGEIGESCMQLGGEPGTIECLSLICGDDGKCAAPDGEALCSNAN